MEEFFSTQCGVGYDQLLATERIGFPTVNIQTEFRAPILYGDEIDVEVLVSRPGRTSAIFEYRITRVSDGQLCVESTQVHVAMNLNSRRPVPLPEKIRAALGSVRTVFDQISVHSLELNLESRLRGGRASSKPQ